jgi:hypothetical protein
MSLTAKVKSLGSVDLFKEAKNDEWFVGRPFYLDYERALILVSDAWKKKVGGIPQGTFLLAFYENEANVQEAILLRAIRPTKLPTDSDIIGSMIEFYKDNLKTSGSDSHLDDFTRYEFSFSGLECRVLGTFYASEGKTLFGADVENFFSAHNYSVFKPRDKVLEMVANFRDGSTVPGCASDVRVGKVRYSSSTRLDTTHDEVPVYVTPIDFLGKRTALFGMTRTGKSNSVKKIIQATVNLSDLAKGKLSDKIVSPDESLSPFTQTGEPKYPAGQIIFDINGEYANANMQDQGTAIFEIYKDRTVRFSVLEKKDKGFKVMKVNFFNDILSGFEMVRSHLSLDSGDYVQSFASADLSPKEGVPEEHDIRFQRKKAAYLCCLEKAGFKVPRNFKIRFVGEATINGWSTIDPKAGIDFSEASAWFEAVWDKYLDDDAFFSNYKRTHKGSDWFDEDLKSIVTFLTGKSERGGKVNGYKKLRPLIEMHTDTVDMAFDTEILQLLRNGKIVILDLSQGNPELQRIYAEKICKRIFSDAMDRFVNTKENNFVQFYFEEAHNLFPKKDDKDLSQIYNRLAKEGAKLNLGLAYATQEVSSISSNILKNTQNWFIAHLNNDDELKELKKYYDFGDFVEGLIRFSANTDKGFARIKTYSNSFVVPVQVDRFVEEK